MLNTWLCFGLRSVWSQTWPTYIILLKVALEIKISLQSLTLMWPNIRPKSKVDSLQIVFYDPYLIFHTKLLLGLKNDQFFPLLGKSVKMPSCFHKKLVFQLDISGMIPEFYRLLSSYHGGQIRLCCQAYQEMTHFAHF